MKSAQAFVNALEHGLTSEEAFASLPPTIVCRIATAYRSKSTTRHNNSAGSIFLSRERVGLETNLS